MYDHQNVIETAINSKCCGCCSMVARSANIITTHDIKFGYKNGEDAFSTEDFTSFKFIYIFQYHYFPMSTQHHNLDETEQNKTLFKAITNIAKPCKL